MMEAFAGIDVSVSVAKRLPIVVCRRVGTALVPFSLTEVDQAAPLGRGNQFIVDSRPRAEYVAETVRYLRTVEAHFKVAIRRIGIDAPHSPRPNESDCRHAENALAEHNIHYFKTPTADECEAMGPAVRRHLRGKGGAASLPRANQLWMLFGFDLFQSLGKAGWECLEVYPQATVHGLGVGGTHKSKAGAVAGQLNEAAKHTGWPEGPGNNPLDGICYGSRHDRLDAYLAAWVASLPASKRRALGNAAKNDAIWVPRIGVFAQ
jgi:hypothetical protein